MHLRSFLPAAFAVSVAWLFAATSAVAHADWTVGGDTGRHNVPPRTTITPPGPFLQPSPDSYLYPRPVYPQQQQGHQSWQEQQWQERQWRESQWQERQHSEQTPDWRDWGQRDRNDRGSREREGRDRDWHDRTEQGSQIDRGAPAQSGSDVPRNVPAWGYRDNRR
jgi:hypothetical protein